MWLVFQTWAFSMFLKSDRNRTHLDDRSWNYSHLLDDVPLRRESRMKVKRIAYELIFSWWSKRLQFSIERTVSLWIKALSIGIKWIKPIFFLVKKSNIFKNKEKIFEAWLKISLRCRHKKKRFTLAISYIEIQEKIWNRRIQPHCYLRISSCSIKLILCKQPCKMSPCWVKWPKEHSAFRRFVVRPLFYHWHFHHKFR